MIDRLLPKSEEDRRVAVRLAIALGLLLAGLLCFVLFTGLDWAGAVAKAERLGQRVKTDHYVKTWSWRGAVASIGLLVVLLATLRVWATADPVGSGSDPPPVARSRFFIWCLVGALVLCGLVRLPRLSLGFYNDEAHNFLRMVAGEFRHDDAVSDKFTWRPVGWKDTIWFNHSGNNSQPHSIASRLTYDTWHRLTSAADGEVCEWSVRLPSFLAGLAFLVIIACAVREIAGEGAAMWVTLAGMTHGWLARYFTEARGYSLMLLSIAWLFLCLHHALRTGRWRWWLGYGAGVFGTAWSFMGSVYFLATLNGCLLLRQIWLWKRRGGSFGQVLRPIVAGVLAVIVALPLMLPLIPPLLVALRTHESIRGTMGTAWWANVGSFVLNGCRWMDEDPGNPFNVAMSRWVSAQPLIWIPFFVLAGVTAVGMVRFVRRGSAATVLGISTPLALILAWFLMSQKEGFLHYWYVIFVVPLMLCAFGDGLDSLARWIKVRLGRAAGARVVTSLVAVVALSIPAAVTWRYRTLGRQDERAAVLAARGGVYPHYLASADASRALFGGFWCNANIYDPNMVVINDVAKLDDLVRRAQAEKRPLFVTFSHRGLALANAPDLVRRLEQSGEFVSAGIFYGQEEEQFTEYLYRLK
jgi:Dolichyl-phosphate-mannose-protein mannosyltransferase